MNVSKRNTCTVTVRTAANSVVLTTLPAYTPNGKKNYPWYISDSEKEEQRTLELPPNSIIDETSPEINLTVGGSRVSWTKGRKRFYLNRVQSSGLRCPEVDVTWTGKDQALTFVNDTSEIVTSNIMYRATTSTGEWTYSFYVKQAGTGSQGLKQQYQWSSNPSQPKVDPNGPPLLVGTYTTVERVTSYWNKDHTYLHISAEGTVEARVLGIFQYTWNGRTLYGYADLSSACATRPSTVGFYEYARAGKCAPTGEGYCQYLSDTLEIMFSELRIASYNKGATRTVKEIVGKAIPANPNWLISLISGKISAFGVGHPPKEHKAPWNDMAYEAYKSVDFLDTNGIAYIKDAVEMRETVNKMASTLKSVAKNSGFKKAKALAGLYLGIHYGLKLSVLDTKEYVQGLQKAVGLNQLVHRVAEARTSYTDDGWKITDNYQAYYRNRTPKGTYSTVEMVNEFLRYADIMPTPENAWDMVPFSFVVDWFTDFGDCLTAIGNLNSLQTYYETLGCTMSTRAQRDLILDETSGQEEFSFKAKAYQYYYVRKCQKTFLVPIRSADATDPPSPLKHWLEGAALVVSMS